MTPKTPLQDCSTGCNTAFKSKKSVLIIQDIIFQMVRAALRLSDHFFEIEGFI